MTTFAIGQEVLLLKLMGEEFERPLEGIVISNDIDSRMYRYMVMVPGKRRGVLALEDWLVPAQIVINEVSDTPWE